MASGADFNLSFADELMVATAKIQASQQQVDKAAKRAARKTFKWLKIRMARELSSALGINRKVIDRRFYYDSAKQSFSIWFGADSMSADYVGHVRQNQSGAKVNSHRWAGGFAHDIFRIGHDKGWIREVRANELGVELPEDTRRLKKRGNTDSGRYPLLELGVDIESQSIENFKRYEKRALHQFSKIIGQELNYAVKHE